MKLILFSYLTLSAGASAITGLGSGTPTGLEDTNAIELTPEIKLEAEKSVNFLKDFIAAKSAQAFKNIYDDSREFYKYADE